MHLVDCGYGALASLIRANRNYRDIAQVFLTHLHDDHIRGPGLVDGVTSGPVAA